MEKWICAPDLRIYLILKPRRQEGIKSDCGEMGLEECSKVEGRENCQGELGTGSAVSPQTRIHFC